MSQARILPRIPTIVTIAVFLIPLGFAEKVCSHTTKAKAKTLTKSSHDLDEEFAKYTAPLAGEESPIAAGKRVTVTLSSGKTLTDFGVAETQLGNGDETLKFLSLQDADGKKKQKLTSSAIARIHPGDHDVQFESTKNRAYGLTPAELIGQYGRSIGLNGLRS